jgi:hypothetical protein
MEKEKPILSGTFGSGGAGGILRFILAAALIGFQITIFTGQVPLDLHRPAAWMPGVAALLLLAMSFIYRMARGTFSIFPDRIVISHSSEDKEPIYLSAVETVEIGNVSVTLTGEDKRIMLRIFRPVPVKAAGWLWMLKEYPRVVEENWLERANEFISPSKDEKAIRIFLGPNGEELFLDPGFVISTEGQKWFFPMDDAALIPDQQKGKNSMSRAFSQVVHPIQFIPSPSVLPLYQWCHCLLHSRLPDTSAQLELLAEAHGGIRLESESEPGIYSCAYAQLQAEVHFNG